MINERTSTKFVDSLKERINPFRTRDPDIIATEKIKNDPQYAQMLIKLDNLYIQRAQLIGQLQKVELDIDACLMLAAMNEKKEEINNRPDMHRPNKI